MLFARPTFALTVPTFSRQPAGTFSSLVLAAVESCQEQNGPVGSMCADTFQYKFLMFVMACVQCERSQPLQQLNKPLHLCYNLLQSELHCGPKWASQLFACRYSMVSRDTLEELPYLSQNGFACAFHWL